VIHSKEKLIAYFTGLTLLLSSGCNITHVNSIDVIPNVKKNSNQIITRPTKTIWLTASVKAEKKKHKWSQISGPIDVPLVNSDQLTANFDLPTIAGRYQFKLTTIDAFKKSEDKIVDITINKSAIRTNSVPVTVGVESFVFSNSKITDSLSLPLNNALELSHDNSRDMMVKIWYPAQPVNNASNRYHYGFHTLKKPLAADPEKDGYKQALALFQATGINSDSFYQASPIENIAYPVVFYSHGYGGLIEENQLYYETLVKEGYVVVSIGHTGEASHVTLNNGVGVGLNMAMYQHFVSEVTAPEQSKLLTQTQKHQLASLPLGSTISPELLEKLHYTFSGVKTGFQEHAALWVKDTHFVLNQLKKINSGAIKSHLKGIFNLSKIAASGHSFGGTIASIFCNQEPNCLASINFDGSSVFEQKINDPYLVFRHEPKAAVNDEIRRGYEYSDQEKKIIINERKQLLSLVSHAEILAAQKDIYNLSLKNTAHYDFTKGWVDAHNNGLGKLLLHPILEQSSLQFLNFYLKPAQYPYAQQKLCDQIIAQELLSFWFSSSCLKY